MSLDFVQSLVKGKKGLWDFAFPKKVVGRKATLGGIGDKALTLKLQTSKDYPNLDIKCFLNWDKYEQFTEAEKALVQVLLDELESKSS